jgi:NAD(P)-dependent dehydrogenase (short-subunit alcohol dehydrogenase family)
VLSGGTDGIGRALAAHLLRRGETVVVVGRSQAKFDALVAETGGDAHFVAADLRLVRENRRVVAELRDRFPVIDALVLAAAYVHFDRRLTEEGFEHTFALYYLSRHLLAAGLLPALAAAPRPVVVDTTVPGRRTRSAGTTSNSRTASAGRRPTSRAGGSVSCPACAWPPGRTRAGCGTSW